MADRNFNVNVRGNTSDLDRKLTASEGKLRRFTSTFSPKAMGADVAMGALGAMGLAGGIVGVGIAAMSVAKKVIDFDQSLLRLKIEAGYTSADMLKLKEKLYSAGIATGSTAEEMGSLAKGMYSTSKNSKFVQDDISTMATAFAAVGGDAGQFGEMMGKINRELGLSGEPLKDFTATLYAIGGAKGAEKNVRELTSAMPELIEQAKTFYGEDFTPDKMKNIFAMSAMGVEGISRQLSKMYGSGTQEKLGAMGISVFNKDKTKKDFLFIIRDIITSAHGNRQLLEKTFSEMFGERVAKNILKIGGSIEDIDKLIKTKGNWADIMKDADTKAHSFSGSLTSIQTTMLAIADIALAKPLELFNDFLVKIIKNMQEFKGIMDEMERAAEENIPLSEGDLLVPKEKWKGVGYPYPITDFERKEKFIKGIRAKSYKTFGGLGGSMTRMRGGLLDPEILKLQPEAVSKIEMLYYGNFAENIQNQIDRRHARETWTLDSGYNVSQGANLPQYNFLKVENYIDGVKVDSSKTVTTVHKKTGPQRTPDPGFENF